MIEKDVLHIKCVIEDENAKKKKKNGKKEKRKKGGYGCYNNNLERWKHCVLIYP